MSEEKTINTIPEAGSATAAKKKKRPSFAPGNQAASKYREKYADELVEYIEEAFDTALDAEANASKKETFYPDGTVKAVEPVFLPPKCPSLARFARRIGVSPHTLILWAEQHERFSIAYAYAKEMLKELIVEGAMTKQYDTNFAKFALANFHGVRDVSETTIAVKQAQTVLPPEIDEECD